MRNAHCRTWKMVRKLTNKENEKLTLKNPEYGEKMTNEQKKKLTWKDRKYGPKP